MPEKTLECCNMMIYNCLDWDSNPAPLDYRSDALPTELDRHIGTLPKSLRLVADH